MKRPAAFGLSLFLLGASAAFSQAPATIRFVNGAQAFPMQAVTGAPYSAEQVQEHVQTLLDGTQIRDKQLLFKEYRDSQGRTRTEQPMFLPNPNVPDTPMNIQISDPVAGVRYTFDTQKKTVHRVIVPASAASASRWYASSGAGGGSGGRLGAVLPAPGQSGVAAFRQAPPNPPDATRPQVTSEDLGTQVMEGVGVEGHRQTTSYPVNSQGNDRPFAVTTEIWTSPDLGLVVLQKNTDPRTGEHTIKLTNLSRDEPDPSLFQPPAGYPVTDDAVRSPAEQRR